MKKAETLLEIKRAEEEIRGMKTAAERERDRILRDARREVLELQDRVRGDVDGHANAILREAEGELAKERETILAKGRKDADALKSKGAANVDRAVEKVLAKFQGALDA